MPSIGKPGRRDISKENYWRDTVTKWRESGLSKTQFCKNQEININSLCTWTKVIKARDHEAAAVQLRERKKKAATGRRTRSRAQSAATVSDCSPKKSNQEFVQVNLPPGYRAGYRAGSLAASGVIEIVHPDGLLIRLPADLVMPKILSLLDSLSSE